MDNSLTLVIYMAVMTWLLSMLASQIRVKGWTMNGNKLAMGNRDNLPESSAFAGRADRTARNTAEALLLFATITLVAHAASVHSPRIDAGANTFFYARLLYIPVYYIGISYVRTAVWGVGVFGLGMMISALV